MAKTRSASEKAKLAKQQIAYRQLKITPRQALLRLDVMAISVFRDVRIALSAEAVLEEGNAIVRKDPYKPRPSSYEAVSNSLLINLAMSLARLFDEGTRHWHPDNRHTASIPMMLRLVQFPSVCEAVSRKARRWLPNDFHLADDNEAACRKAIAKALAAYKSVAGNPAGRGLVKRLKNIRDARMAHNLPFKRQGSQPTYNGLFVLADVARVVADECRLAVHGMSQSLEDFEDIERRHGAEFWRAAFGNGQGSDIGGNTNL